MIDAINSSKAEHRLHKKAISRDIFNEELGILDPARIGNYSDEDMGEDLIDFGGEVIQPFVSTPMGLSGSEDDYTLEAKRMINIHLGDFSDTEFSGTEDFEKGLFEDLTKKEIEVSPFGKPAKDYSGGEGDDDHSPVGMSIGVPSTQDSSNIVPEVDISAEENPSGQAPPEESSYYSYCNVM